MFHVTNQNFGKSKLIYPRKLADFPNISGISVAPTPNQAIFAALGCTENKPKRLFLYKAVGEHKVFVPKHIYDANITNETIITSRCRFVLHYIISCKSDLELISNLHYTLHEYHDSKLRKELWRMFNSQCFDWNLTI